MCIQCLTMGRNQSASGASRWLAFIMNSPAQWCESRLHCKLPELQGGLQATYKRLVNLLAGQTLHQDGCWPEQRWACKGRLGICLAKMHWNTLNSKVCITQSMRSECVCPCRTGSGTVKNKNFPFPTRPANGSYIATYCFCRSNQSSSSLDAWPK